ncbi:MAG: flavodoxin [Lactobacillus sp.]|jgi:flavodoxin short chain|nr:flavodoxin [Lactobacillus sp.]
MATVKIVWASMSGRNEQIANFLNEYFMQKGAIVDMSEVSQTDAEDFANYDIDVVVSYTYHQGELPDEAEDFFEDLKTLDLKGKVYGLTGSSSSKHKYFGRALDYYDEVFQQIGATKGSAILKIDEDPSADDLKKLRQFADDLLAAV